MFWGNFLYSFQAISVFFPYSVFLYFCILFLYSFQAIYLVFIYGQSVIRTKINLRYNNDVGGYFCKETIYCLLLCRQFCSKGILVGNSDSESDIAGKVNGFLIYLKVQVFTVYR